MVRKNSRSTQLAKARALKAEKKNASFSESSTCCGDVVCDQDSLISSSSSSSIVNPPSSPNHLPGPSTADLRSSVDDTSSSNLPSTPNQNQQSDSDNIALEEKSRSHIKNQEETCREV